MSRAVPEAEALGDTGTTFGFALARAWMRFHDDYALALAPMNLTPNRMLALAFVVHNAGADQSSLGRALGINRASTMAMVDKLEADGFIRRAEGIDRRSNALQPTPVGLRAYHKAMQIERGIEAALLSGMKSSEVAAVREMLERIVLTQISK